MAESGHTSEDSIGGTTMDSRINGVVRGRRVYYTYIHDEVKLFVIMIFLIFCIGISGKLLKQTNKHDLPNGKKCDSNEVLFKGYHVTKPQNDKTMNI